MSNEPLTRENIEDDPTWRTLLTPRAYADLLVIVSERDQLRASCDLFRGRIQALEMERDALQSTSRSHKLMREAQAERDEAHAMIKAHAEVVDQFRAERDAARAEAARLRAIALRLLDGLEGGHKNALYGPTRDAISGSTAEWLAQHDAKVRKEAFGSSALELRASIACAKRDGDPLDLALLEAAAETFEAYADGDGLPDDERNNALLCPICKGDGRYLAGNSVWPCPHRAALSPTTDGAPKPTDACPRNADGIHRPWHDDGAEDLCRCGKVIVDGAPKPKCATCGDTKIDDRKYWGTNPCPDCKAAP